LANDGLLIHGENTYKTSGYEYDQGAHFVTSQKLEYRFGQSY